MRMQRNMLFMHIANGKYAECGCVYMFQVYIRKGRLLLSLQAVKRALKLAGPADPDVHRLVVRLCKAVQQPQTQTSNAQVSALHYGLQGCSHCAELSQLG